MDQSVDGPAAHSQAENREVGSFPGAAAGQSHRAVLGGAPAPHPILPGLAWFAGSRHQAVTGRWSVLASAQEATDHWDTARASQGTRDRWYGSEHVAQAAAARSDSQTGVAPAAAADHLGSWESEDRQGRR